MGEKEPSYHTESLNQHLKQTPEQLAPSNEAATVQDSSKQQQKRHSPLSAEIYTKTPEKRVLKQPVRPSPLLKTFGNLYIAKEILLTEIEKLRDENQELQAENQDLREKVERRRQQARESAAKSRQSNREKYNAYMREYRERQKQQVESQEELSPKQ
jgi:regulator of replication initiation timing